MALHIIQSYQVKGLESIKTIFDLIFKITHITSDDTKDFACLENENGYRIPSMLPWQHGLKQT